MVENLNFHSIVSSIRTNICTNTNTIVHSFYAKAEFKTVNEVTIFLLGI